jgi:hypothetical protein
MIGSSILFALADGSRLLYLAALPVQGYRIKVLSARAVSTLGVNPER